MKKQSSMQSFFSAGVKKNAAATTAAASPTSANHDEAGTADAWAGFESASVLNKRSIAGKAKTGTSSSSRGSGAPVTMIVIDDDDDVIVDTPSTTNKVAVSSSSSSSSNTIAPATIPAPVEEEYVNPYANIPHPAVKKQRSLPSTVTNSAATLFNAELQTNAKKSFPRSSSFSQYQSKGAMTQGNKSVWISPAVPPSSAGNKTKSSSRGYSNENYDNIRGVDDGDNGNEEGDGWISTFRGSSVNTAGAGKRTKPSNGPASQYASSFSPPEGNNSPATRTVSRTGSVKGEEGEDDDEDGNDERQSSRRSFKKTIAEDSDEDRKGTKHMANSDDEDNDNDDDEERQRKAELMKTNYSLSSSQKTVLDAIMQRRSVFFTGAAGTGKSFILQIIRDAADVMGISNKVSFTAPTGIAACNIQGLTVHSWAGIGMGSEPIDKLLPIVERNRHAKARWQSTEILVIDEISMLSAEFLDKLDIIGRRVRNKCHIPFGGIQIVLCGDFFQLPPVGLGKSTKFCFESNVWKELFEEDNNNSSGGGSYGYNRGNNKRHSKQHTGLMICLNKVFRQKDDSLFLNLLTEIRLGQVSKHSLDLLQQKAFESMNVDHELDDIRPTKLFATNQDVDTFNEKEMKRLCSGGAGGKGDDDDLEVITYKAVDVGKDQYMNQLRNGMKVPSELKLCKGAQVMLLKNLEVSAGLVNGARGTVIGFAKDVTGRFKKVPIVKFRTMDNRDVVETIRAESWSIKQGDIELASRNQIPLMLAWAISIHKSQGMTIPFLEVSFNRMFEYGQAYVALSRATSLAGLTLRQYQSNVIKAHPQVRQFYQKLYQSMQQTNGGQGITDEVCQVLLKDFVAQFTTLDTSYDNEQWLESRNNPYNKTSSSAVDNTNTSKGNDSNKKQFDEFKFLEGSDFDPRLPPRMMKTSSTTATPFISPMTPATFLPNKTASTSGVSSSSSSSSIHRNAAYSVTTTAATASPGKIVTGRLNTNYSTMNPVPQTYLPAQSTTATATPAPINQNPVQQLPLSEDLKRRIEENRQAALAKLALFKKRREEETAATMESLGV